MVEITRSFAFDLRGIAMTAHFAEDKPHGMVCFQELCETLGLNVDYQRRKIRKDIYYADRLFHCLKDVRCNGKSQKQKKLFMDIRVLPLWLLYTNANRVREEYRDTVVSMQEEFADFLWAIHRTSTLPPEILEKYPGI